MSTHLPNPAEQRARRAAAEWLTKHDRGLTATEQDEFFQWLAADPRHGAWFSRHQSGWLRLDAIADWRPEHGAAPNPDVLAHPSSRARWLRPALFTALAAGLALVAGALWLRAPTAHPAALAVATATEAGGYERRVLDDGSVAELNRGAEIEVNYSAGERRVVLRRGEVLFTVAKNPARPFIVRARGVDVRAVGTAFNVRLTEHAIEVIVTEGVVALARGGSGDDGVWPTLAAGERALVPRGAGGAPVVGKLSQEEIDRRLAWQPRLLGFTDESLATILNEFNRHNPVVLRVADPALRELRLTVRFRSDNVSGFLRLLAADFGVRSEPDGGGEIVLRAAR